MDDKKLNASSFYSKGETRSWTEIVQTDFTYDMSATYDETYVFDDPYSVVPSVIPPYSGDYDGPGSSDR